MILEDSPCRIDVEDSLLRACIGGLAFPSQYVGRFALPNHLLWQIRLSESVLGTRLSESIGINPESSLCGENHVALLREI